METSVEKLEPLSMEEVANFLKDHVRDAVSARKQEIGQEHFSQIEKMAALWVVDSRWKEHLLVIDSLREGIHLRGYAQTEPIIAYQKESFIAFQETIAAIKEGIVDTLFKTRVVPAQEEQGVFNQAPKTFEHSEYSAIQRPQPQQPQQPQQQKPQQMPVQRTEKKVGRNDPCPCGSGKKYKKCCGG
jgi:preprotein translocase subunit SecA